MEGGCIFFKLRDIGRSRLRFSVYGLMFHVCYKSMISTASPYEDAWEHVSDFSRNHDVQVGVISNGSFRKLGVPYSGVLIIRILLFRVLY